MEVGEIDVGESGSTGGGCLEPAVQDADSGRECGDDGIFELW